MMTLASSKNIQDEGQSQSSVAPLFQCPRLCRLCMMPVEKKWWEAIQGRPAGPHDICSRGYHGHDGGWHVVHTTCAETQPEAARRILQGQGGLSQSFSSSSSSSLSSSSQLYPSTGSSSHSSYPSPSSSSLQSLSLSSPVFGLAAASTSSAPTSATRQTHQFPRLFAEHERPGGSVLYPLTRYPPAVGAPSSPYGPYPHAPSPSLVSVSASPSTMPSQGAPPALANPFPGFNACRHNQTTLEMLLDQYPNVDARELLETGLSVDDIKHMYINGGSQKLVHLLAQRGLDYTLLRQHGKTRTFFGTMRELDATTLPFGRRDWQWLGVQQPSDIGLTMAAWNQLPA